MFQKKWLRLVVVLIVGILNSCAADVGDIDRTQAGKLHKKAFEGVWYYRQTVVDVPFAAGTTFIGEQSSLERLQWEISENYLTAYRTYEKVRGSERPSQSSGKAYQGAPVASFRILSHFDVVRVYNDATGEQTNVIEENTYDRPWYDRQYMRVDWSENLIGHFEFLAGGAQGLALSSQAASYVVTDPKHEDAPLFSTQDENGWHDVRDPFDWGTLKKIDYFDLTLKLLVKPDVFYLADVDGNQYEMPACWFYEYGPWDCASQTIKVRASFLKAEPSDYQPLSYPDNEILRYDDGKPMYVGMDDEGYQALCDEAAADDCYVVRVPMFDRFGFFRRERESYNRHYGVSEAGREYWIDRFNIWQKTRNEAGEILPYAERSSRQIVYYLSPEFPEALVEAAQETGSWWNEAFKETVATLQGQRLENSDDVFVVRPNSGQRNGDLRYNHLYWVDKPQFDSLLGYGPSAADPLTGEIIAADAYVYGGAIDTYAAFGADLVAMMRGDLQSDILMSGENTTWAMQQLTKQNNESAQLWQQRIDKAMQGGLRQRLQQVQARGKKSFRSRANFAKARMQLADGDPRFAGLWHHEMDKAFGARQLGSMRPSQFLNGRMAKAWRRHRLNLAKRGIDFQAFNDTGVLGLMDEFEGLELSEVRARIRAYLFKAVAAHEIGHTLGLRHNFAGSADALNYHDAYWKNRSAERSVLQLPSNEELKNGVREYSYASIMDYGARFNSDIRGLGKYDKAAIKFGYGQLVEVFDEAPSPDVDALLYFYDIDDIVANLKHYSALPTLFQSTPGAGDGATRLAKRHDVPLAEIKAWLLGQSRLQDFTDRIVPYRFCSDEYVGARWDCQLWDEGADPFEMVSYAQELYESHYIFNSFKRHRRYFDPLDVYSRSYSRIMQPMASLYQLWIYDQWQWSGTWSWLHGQGIDLVDHEDWQQDANGGLSATAAALKSLQFLSKVIATPEPGSYYRDEESNLLEWWSEDEDVICAEGQDSAVDACSEVYIPLGQGRYAFSLFDADSGYHWFERIRVVGSFWDKLAAIEVLSDPTTYFLGVDDVADYTSYNLGYNVAFPHAVHRLFGAIVSGESKYYAPRLMPNRQIVYPKLYDSLEHTFVDGIDTSNDPCGLLEASDMAEEHCVHEAGVQSDAGAGFSIDPATNETISLYALFYGMALLNANFEQAFNDHAKIWLKGHGEAIDVAAGAELATFRNPYNGRIYQAVKSKDTKHYSLGFQMLQKANAHAKAILTVDADCFFSEESHCAEVDHRKWQLKDLIENIEILRGYYDVLGYAYF